jgi:hypothetical protein
VASVVRALTGAEADSFAFSESMEWRLPNGYTLPWGIEKQLKENGLETSTPRLKKLSDDERLAYLKQELSLGKAAIILGERSNYEHYITILGFDGPEDQFFAYDSLHRLLHSTLNRIECLFFFFPYRAFR